MQRPVDTSSIVFLALASLFLLVRGFLSAAPGANGRPVTDTLLYRLGPYLAVLGRVAIIVVDKVKAPLLRLSSLP